MRYYDIQTDEIAFGYLTDQRSIAAKFVNEYRAHYATLREAGEETADIRKQIPYCFRVSVTIARGIEKGIPQPPIYLRLWQSWDGFQVEAVNGRYFLRAPHLKGEMELVDYTPPEDNEFFVALCPDFTRNGYRAFFYEKGEYRHDRMAIC